MDYISFMAIKENLMLEEQIKQLIIDQYGSMRAFAHQIDIPNTTLRSILERGIINANVGNVLKIYSALGIRLDTLISNVNSITSDYEETTSVDKVVTYKLHKQEEKVAQKEQSVGIKIKNRRKQIKISAEQLADKIGISRSTMYRYENGDIEKIPTETLARIAVALNTSPAYFIGWKDESISSPEAINLITDDLKLQRSLLNKLDELLAIKRDELAIQVETNNKLDLIMDTLTVSLDY